MSKNNLTDLSLGLFIFLKHMASVPHSYISAALFDLKQDIIADIPRGIIEHWLSSGQTREDALAILEPFKVNGYILSSDTSGLSKLSGQKRLIEVLTLVSHPKEIVYAHGTALGGRAMGVWAADNTQMFFEKDTDASKLVEMSLKILDDIARLCEVKIGIGLHYGTYYELGGGLYGADADFVENFTEELVKGGELWVSEVMKERAGSGFTFEQIEGESLYRTSGSSINASNVSFNVEYPLPFSREFYNDLRQLRGREDYDQYLAELESRYLRDACVVLAERGRLAESYEGEVSLLGDLSLCAVMENDAEELLKTHNGEEIKTVGPLGIYIFDSTSDGIAFALDFRKVLASKSLPCRIGVDRGSVLVCTLPHGTKDIAGEPVNIASKLAQDKGVFGSVYVSDNCKYALPQGTQCTELEVAVSGITIKALEL